MVAQADKISTMLKAAGVTVEPYWPALFAKTLAVQKLDALITNVGSGAHYAACGPGGLIAGLGAGVRDAGRESRKP